MAQQSPRGCLVGNTAVELAGHDTQIARAIRTIQDRQRAALIARIEQGQRDGDVGPDILVNNVGAGTADRFRLGGFLDISDVRWRDLFDLNLFSAIRMTRAARPSLLE
ncbi:MAG: SDR family NAD(P)-dependent oxidoreductase [Nakamurella sp.]